jgi:putative resolvase
MMSEKLLTLQEACIRLWVHPNTLRKWDREGKISVVRTVGGMRIPESEVERLMGFVKSDVSGKAVIYVRVSYHDRKQRGDLKGWG